MQDIPSDVTHAREEVRLEGGVVADVVLFRDDVPAVAVEILVGSPVDADKAGRFTIPWVELRASDVLDRPYWWVAVQDGLLPFTCPACAERLKRGGQELGALQRRASTVAERLGVDLPPSPPYRYVGHRCWKCGAESVVFLWPGGGRHSRRRPPAPVPASVRYTATDGGQYWANTCPQCSAVQGDFYLERDNADYARVLVLCESELAYG